MLSEIKLPLFQEIDQLIRTIGNLASYDPLLNVVKGHFQTEINQHLTSLKSNTPHSDSEESSHPTAIKNKYLEIGHEFAVTQFLFDMADKPLTRTHVLLLTEILIGRSNYRDKPKTLSHSSGEQMQTPPPEEIPNRLKNLLQGFNQNVQKGKIHPIVCCAHLHHHFTTIHPFNDWNGRIARLLLNVALMNQGYLPVLIRKEDRRDYYEALESADKGDLLPLASFIGHIQKRSIQDFCNSPEYISIQGKFDLENQLDHVKGNERCLVLTEDSTSNNLLSVILESSGFQMDEIMLVSYEGCSKIASAHLFSLYAKKKMPNTQILVHRDRDYLTDYEISQLKRTFDKIDVHFFCTKGTDIESHFLDPNHIKHCYPKIDPQTIAQMVSEVIEEVMPKSMDYLFKKEFGNRPQRSTHLHGALVRLVNRKRFRFTHGKTAYRVLQNKLHNIIRKKPKLERPSPALDDKQLRQIARVLW